MNWTFLEKIGKAFLPKKSRPYVHKYLMKAGYDEVPYMFFGILFYVTLIITFFVYLGVVYIPISQYHPILLMIMTVIIWSAIQLGLAFGIILIVYLYLDLKIYNRTKLMEKLLPDYLQLVVTNLKGGMSFEKSLWAAIRPEFKVLSKEITIVSKKVLTGNDLSEALAEFTKKYDSPILRRSMELIIGEVITGGKISKVIDNVIDTLRKTRTLREEMAASTLTYLIFIGAIVIFIAPALFALSHQLLRIVVGFTSQIASTTLGQSSLPISVSEVTLDPDAFRLFSVFALSVISIASAIIISIIQKGDVKGGIKYMPIFFIFSLLMYFVLTAGLGAVFGGIAFG